MLIKPEKVLKNEGHILELVELLARLRTKVDDKYPHLSEETRKWCVEQAILRTSLNDGVDFGI